MRALGLAQVAEAYLRAGASHLRGVGVEHLREAHLRVEHLRVEH